MPGREIMMTELRKQRDLLGELITHMESKADLNAEDFSRYDAITKRVETNLTKLKRYQHHQKQGEKLS